MWLTDPILYSPTNQARRRLLSEAVYLLLTHALLSSWRSTMPRDRCAANSPAAVRVRYTKLEILRDATNARRETRRRTIKDLDVAASHLGQACRLILDSVVPDAPAQPRNFLHV